MKKNYIQWILALALIVSGGVLLTRAQAPGGPGMGGPGGWKHRGGMFGPGMGPFAKYLDLTDAQKSQVKAMFEEQRSAVKPLMQQLATARKDMLTATANGAFDQAKVSAIATHEAQLHAQLAVMREALHAKIYNTVLTSEQKTKVDQMRQRQLERINSRLQKSEANAPK